MRYVVYRISSISVEVIKIIAKNFPKDYKLVGNEHLYIDLGIDSLEFLESLLEIERTFSIIIEIDEFESCLYLNNLINLVLKKIDNRGDIFD